MSTLLRVVSVRSQNPLGFGGCIFAGREIDVMGWVADAKRLVVVRAPGAVVGDVSIQPGQWWEVSGPSFQRVVDLNGFTVTETQIEAEKAVMTRPSGEHLVSFIAGSADFPKIGAVKARRLWERFGTRLYEILDSGDAAELRDAIGDADASTLVEGWKTFGDSATLQWFQRHNFDSRLARSVMRFFGRKTVQKIEEDPYRLLSFCANWRDVDKLAREQFRVAVDDSRRLSGAVEEACYRIFNSGHTSALSSTLMVHLKSILGAQQRSGAWPECVNKALASGLTNGSFVVGPHGVQPLGPMVMEKLVAVAVADRIKKPEPIIQLDEVEAILAKYEGDEGIVLNPEQREAVRLGASYRFAVITGGAGVGKTTVLKALYRVFDISGTHVIQLALAGRAAKRMTEATGRPAVTIASFLRSASEFTNGNVVAVVDEASMVDIITMSRLVEKLGQGTRLLLVGDAAQLMPVGPGLVLHALCRVSQVPSVALTTVKRYGSAIAGAAQSIRDGKWPSLSSATGNSPVSFLSVKIDKSFAEVVYQLFAADQANTQILCARRSGFDGVNSVNTYCQQRITASGPQVLVWSAQHESLVGTGLRLNDSIICTRNLWDRGLQNGSLGRIVEIAAQSDLPAPFEQDLRHRALAWVEWDDGVRRPLSEDMLDDIELGYAITVHKAQGSQWRRVIVPLSGHRLLDRTLVYTAITRAQAQVIMVGDEHAARAAVEAPPKAAGRNVALDLTLRAILA